jgi:hypothetical protein
MGAKMKEYLMSIKTGSLSLLIFMSVPSEHTLDASRTLEIYTRENIIDSIENPSPCPEAEQMRNVAPIHAVPRQHQLNIWN